MTIDNSQFPIHNFREVFETMKNLLIVTIASFSILALVGCGSSTAQNSNSPGGAEAGAVQPAASAADSQPAGSATLGEDYKDALPIVAQLTLGSLKLDTGDSSIGSGQDLSIDAVEAGKLLPLWQAYQSLGNSDNTAEAELSALVSQIQDTMRPEQVQACLLYTSPSPRDRTRSRMPSSA